MPQSEVLGRHLSPTAKEGDEGPQQQPNPVRHEERIRAENESRGSAQEIREPLPDEALPRPS
jgi:hypothetical protein